MQGKGEEQLQLDPEDALLLRGYVERFLQSSYNILMTGLQKDLDPGLNISRLTNEDFLRFFKLTSFFTRYVRLQEVQTSSFSLSCQGTRARCDYCHPCHPLPRMDAWMREQMMISSFNSGYALSMEPASYTCRRTSRKQGSPQGPRDSMMTQRSLHMQPSAQLSAGKHFGWCTPRG